MASGEREVASGKREAVRLAPLVGDQSRIPSWRWRAPGQPARSGRFRFPRFACLTLMRKAMLFVLVFLSLSFAARTAEDAGEDARECARDGVRTYALPELNLSPYWYTGGWKAELDVEVEPDGRVGAIHPLTDVWLPEMNVAKWTFVPLGGRQVRWHRVTIVFDDDVDSLEPPSLAARYESPFTLHIWRKVALVRHLPRVDGRIPEKSCEVHHEAMQVELLPFQGCGGPPLPAGLEGVPGPPPEAEPRELFPNVFDFAAGGTALESKMEVYVCASCRRARDAWRAAHQPHPSSQ
jgi:hypothetical protein